MSTLTKVFIVINFVFAIVMLCVQAVLFAQREDWKGKWVEEVNNHTKTLMVKDSEIQYWIKENNNKDQFISQLKTRINELENDKESLANDNRDLNDRLSNLQGTFQELSSNYDAMTKELQVIGQERAKLRNDLAELSQEFERLKNDKDSVTQDFLTLQAKLESITKELSSAEIRLTDVIKEKKEYQTILDELQRRGIDVDILPTKPIRGKVQAYDDTSKICVLNVGEEHGVKIGMKFSIYRNDNFVASGQIVDTEKDYSYMKVELTKLTPRPGDSSANHFLPAGTFSK